MMLMKIRVDRRIEFGEAEKVASEGTVVGACTPNVDLQADVERTLVRSRCHGTIILLELTENVEAEATAQDGACYATAKNARWLLNNLPRAEELEFDSDGLFCGQDKYLGRVALSEKWSTTCSMSA